MENSQIELKDLADSFAEDLTLRENLIKVVQKVARIFAAERCSILMLNEDRDEKPTVSVYDGHAPLSPDEEKVLHEAELFIASFVISRHQSFSTEDESQSAFTVRYGIPHKRFLASPLIIDTRVIGVVTVSRYKHGESFGLGELSLLDAIALFIGKSIQAIRLKMILQARFAQFVLASELKETVGSSLGSILNNPDKIAKLLAKTFYKEMTKAGFEPNQIISAACEIIGQLSTNLRRHNNRIKQRAVECHNDR